MAHETVLIVSTDGDTHPPIEEALQISGYAVRVAGGLQRALESLAVASPSAIVISCPGASEVCRALRRATELPILVLLPPAAEQEVVKCLEAGADDCQCLDTGTREVVLRLRALLRRYAWVFAPRSEQAVMSPNR